VRTLSAVYARSDARHLSPITLGTANDSSASTDIDEAGETTKSFMLHYNFPASRRRK